MERYVNLRTPKITYLNYLQSNIADIKINLISVSVINHSVMKFQTGAVCLVIMEMYQNLYQM